MTFDQAMAGILNNKERWRREYWNRAHYIDISSGYIACKNVRTITITMYTGEINAWSPSQCDMLAKDWVRVDM